VCSDNEQLSWVRFGPCRIEWLHWPRLYRRISAEIE
jgi:hypothetical protein